MTEKNEKVVDLTSEEPKQSHNDFGLGFTMPRMEISDIIDTSMLPSF